MSEETKLKCKFCRREVSKEYSELFYMGHNKPNKDDFVRICCDCADDLRDAIEDIAEESKY